MTRILKLLVLITCLSGCSKSVKTQPANLELAHIDEVNREQMLLSIDASVEAYNMFDNKAPTVFHFDRVKVPDGYEIVEGWTGVDSIFSMDKTVECYGIVFRSQQAPHTYIFAFRGTDSFLDIVDDAGVMHTTFVPHNADAVVPSNIHVEAGFHGVYTNSTADTKSMQHQLFALIEKYNASEKPISELWITGHSLGAAISELFTLDLALSAPAVKAVNYNFACPRLGNIAFADFYQQQPAQSSTKTRTVRIQNTHDKVPCVPVKRTKYRHIMPAYLIAFTKAEHWHAVDLEFIVHNHSSVNYQTVLHHALKTEDGVYVGDDVKSPAGYTLRSKKPDPNDVGRFW